MLELFRRYQRYIFFVVTFFIVISFSFFGTFSVIPALQSHSITAFTAVDGKKISRADVEELALFIATDNDDKWFSGGQWGPNFLNDGVIRKDILENGIGILLLEQFAPDLSEELASHFVKEQRYVPYQHPEASFLNASGIWAYLAPDINKNLTALQQQPNAVTPEALQARVGLYLAHQRFPVHYLRQILINQEKQYNWLHADPELQNGDLSLFGYKSLQDWFGTRFVRVASEFIINSAIQAQALGYEVTRAEVAADLMRNATVSFQQQKNNPAIGVTSPSEYYNQQLQAMNLDQTRAVTLWRQVMLFRRLYDDKGSTPLVERLPFDRFEQYARETVEGAVYTVPKLLQLQNFRLLQQLEAYLKAIAPQTENPLALPEHFNDMATIAATSPQLIQKRYTVEASKIEKASLVGQVSLKEMWEWQVSDQHWKELQAFFPPLAVKQATTPEERQAVLDGLDELARGRINQIARTAIVESHPEWLEEALAKAPTVKVELGLSLKGTQQPINGLEDPQELIALLDKESTVPKFTADNKMFYRFNVLERQGEQVLTFGEAIGRKALENAPEVPLTELIAAIRSDAIASGVIASTASLTNDRAASLRLLYHVRTAMERLRNDKGAEIAAVEPLAAQWNLDNSSFTESRALATSKNVDRAVALSMTPGSWSDISTPSNGAMSFFTVQKREVGPTEKVIRQKVQQAHRQLSWEAQRKLAASMIAAIVERHAIDLTFLNRPINTPEIAPEGN